MSIDSLIQDLRSRINPAYAEHIGTESWERKICADALEEQQIEIQRLRADLDEERQRRFEGNRCASEEHAEEVRALKSEIDALRADAARYQFIRSGGAYIEPHETGEIYVATDVSAQYYRDVSEIDIAIDGAIESAAGEKE